MFLKGLLQSHTCAVLSLTLICLLPSVSSRSVGFAQGAPVLGQNAKYSAGDGAAGDQFGASLDLSSNSGFAGAPKDDDNGTDSGAVYFGEADANDRVFIVKLLAKDGAAGDAFGSAVSGGSRTVVVGAPKAGGTGAAYVFVRKGGRWVQKAKLVASDAAVGDGFGSAVLLNGKTVVVGAPGKNRSTGAVYVFKKKGARWPETQKLVASDGKKRDSFGVSVDMWGTTLIVGAPRHKKAGAAYVFVGKVATQQAKLLASDRKRLDLFGQSVSVAHDTAVIGAPGDDDRGKNSGSAYAFGRVGKKWTQATKFRASDGKKGDAFGQSVAVLLSTVVVGAPFDDDNGANSGSAYAFEHPAGGLNPWGKQQAPRSNDAKLVASDGVSGDFFGASLAMTGDAVLIGATKADAAVRDSGQVYLYAQ
jgi:hypothetical protein